ncbi:hypothetical protein [Aquipuribacter sp. SD81]|uniref:hypothetical protein n=1 Tax=Aquipuribacter sp. SD81 TaxID=3127703 RepID=UPI003016D6C3
MLARELRSTNRSGAHEAVGLYASAAIVDESGAVRRFRAMRLTWNRSEYRDVAIGTQQVQSDLTSARVIVDAVRADLAADDV